MVSNRVSLLLANKKTSPHPLSSPFTWFSARVSARALAKLSRSCVAVSTSAANASFCCPAFSSSSASQSLGEEWDGGLWQLY